MSEPQETQSTPAPVAPAPVKVTQSSYKGAKVGGYVVAGSILAGLLCPHLGEACGLAGGQDVIAGVIGGLLFGAWDYLKRVVFHAKE